MSVVRFRLWLLGGGVIGLTVLLSGCDLLGPPTVKVRLVNHSQFSLDPQFYRKGSAEEEGALFEGTHLYTDFAKGLFPAVAPGKTVQFDLDCEEAAMIGINRPVFGLAGAKTTTRTADRSILLRVGEDYACGDVVTFDFWAGQDEVEITHKTSPR